LQKAIHHVSDHRFALRLALCLYDFGNVCALGFRAGTNHPVW
jgi:hypothetical protein